MFTLLSDIYYTCTRQDEYAILLLGLDNAGKSTLCESLKLHYPSSQQGTKIVERPLDATKINGIRPTVGQNRAKLTIHKTNFAVWDLGGQSTLQALWSRYLPESHAIIYVIDGSTAERFDESKKVLGDLANQIVGDDNVDGTSSSDKGGIPMLIAVNKKDLSDSLDLAYVKDALSEVVSAIGPLEGGVLGCSAIQGTGISAIGDWVSTRVLRNSAARPPIVR